MTHLAYWTCLLRFEFEDFDLPEIYNVLNVFSVIEFSAKIVPGICIFFIVSSVVNIENYGKMATENGYFKKNIPKW